jgi:hypothetical protein
MRSSTNSYFNAVHKVRNPATTALEISGILHLPCDPDQHESTSSLLEQHYDNITTMKSTFDLNELVEATRPIQESLGMPWIEWSFLSDDDDESSNSDKPSDQGTTPEEPHDDTNNDESFSSVLSPLLSYSSPPVGKRNRFKRSHNKNRLVRSKALNSHLSMLETSFLSLPRGDKLDEPRSATDFPFSYDVERWIELAEHVAAKAAPMGLPSKQQHQVQTSLQQQQHTAAVMA